MGRSLIANFKSDLFLARVRQGLGEKHPALTVCQAHTAVAALVRSWWLTGRASTKLIEHAAQTNQHWQRRNTTARSIHTRKTREKLRRLGIKLNALIRCKWP
jgi:hypothetical protein